MPVERAVGEGWVVRFGGWTGVPYSSAGWRPLAPRPVNDPESFVSQSEAFVERNNLPGRRYSLGFSSRRRRRSRFDRGTPAAPQTGGGGPGRGPFGPLGRAARRTGSPSAPPPPPAPGRARPSSFGTSRPLSFSAAAGGGDGGGGATDDDHPCEFPRRRTGGGGGGGRSGGGGRRRRRRRGREGPSACPSTFRLLLPSFLPPPPPPPPVFIFFLPLLLPWALLFRSRFPRARRWVGVGGGARLSRGPGGRPDPAGRLLSPPAPPRRARRAGAGPVSPRPGPGRREGGGRRDSAPRPASNGPGVGPSRGRRPSPGTPAPRSPRSSDRYQGGARRLPVRRPPSPRRPAPSHPRRGRPGRVGTAGGLGDGPGGEARSRREGQIRSVTRAEPNALLGPDPRSGAAAADRWESARVSRRRARPRSLPPLGGTSAPHHTRARPPTRSRRRAFVASFRGVTATGTSATTAAAVFCG